MHSARINPNFLLMLMLTVLLSTLISPSLSLPAPHTLANGALTTQNTLVPHAPTPNGLEGTSYVITGCHPRFLQIAGRTSPVPPPCKGVAKGAPDHRAYCSADGTYTAHNPSWVAMCRSYGCGCRPKGFLEWLFSKSW